nr:hypothetical protein [Tanacetum cinerariifolium]
MSLSLTRRRCTSLPPPPPLSPHRRHPTPTHPPLPTTITIHTEHHNPPQPTPPPHCRTFTTGITMAAAFITPPHHLAVHRHCLHHHSHADATNHQERENYKGAFGLTDSHQGWRRGCGGHGGVLVWAAGVADEAATWIVVAVAGCGAVWRGDSGGVYGGSVDPTPIPHATPLQDQPPIHYDSPPQDQLTTPYESSMPLLTTLMETCALLSQKVAELEKDKHSQALEILQLKKRVNRLKRKKKSKHLGLKRLRRVGAAKRRESSTDTVVGRLNQEDVNAASKRVSAVSAPELVSAAEPTVFDDEDVTMKMAQTLIKLKAKKAKILNEQIAKKLHDEEVQKATARDKQKRANMERALELQRQFDDKEENIDWSAVAEQTLFKPDKDVQETKKKRVADETLLQESFKKLRAAEVSRSESTQEIPSNDPKEMTEENIQNMLEIVPVPEFKVDALQVKYPIIDWEIHTEDILKGFDREDLVALWNLVKEKFSSTEPSEDKEKALWVELKRLFEPDADDVLWKLQRYMHAPLTWKLYSDYRVHHVSSTRGHDIFMLTEKDFPLSNTVMILMLGGKLQVENDNDMARDLVMKIFMEANKPRRKVWIDPHCDQDA